MEIPTNTHDLRLPAWGPYTKRYIGVSHIPDVQRGLRFDLSVFPGYYRRRVDVPNVMWESGYHPWEAAPDLSYFSHRHELEWQDQVYCDVSFSYLSENERLIRCECVNNTDLPQNLVMHYMASLSFPPLRAYTQDPLLPAIVHLPEGGLWVDALDYADLRYAQPRPTDNLVADGQWRGEIRRNGFVNGSGIGAGLGRDSGDTVEYRFSVPASIPEAMLLVRYGLPAGETVSFSMQGIASGEISLPGGAGVLQAAVPVGDLAAGEQTLKLTSRGGAAVEQTLKLTSRGGAAVELDGFALFSAQGEAPQFEQMAWDPNPQIIPGPLPSSLLLKYRHLDNYYGLFWDYEPFEVREFLNDELDRYMRHTVHHHTTSVFRGNGQGHFANVFMRPIPLPVESSRVLYGLVCSGERTAVEASIKRFAAEPAQRDAAYQAARAQVVKLESGEMGERYLSSQERMAATALTNVVYPVYTKRQYIRHNTPGRWWDCLYTWDSGFIGLGLLELDQQRAIDCLNAYMTEPGDPQAAFIHHGSPVPVQFYLFQELMNRTQSPELLAHFYPRLRQYHRFLCGRYGSSTTRTLKSGLIRTWDYFYNSGGWDDYPPQVHVHREGLESSVTPASNTAHAIRTAKILRLAATALGETADFAEYDADITQLSEALQRFSWDEGAGYFSYVRHDEEGQPAGVLRHESGINYNMGLDGAYPLVAGVCTAAQRERLIGHLMTEGRMWSRIGLSTVDQTAPYFRIDGYWNGAVWMPHQWFFWRALLDAGQARARLSHRQGSARSLEERGGGLLQLL